MKMHVCLVSGQPVPNVLPVLLERPEKVALLVTPEMQEQAERLKNIFRARAIQISVYEIPAYDFAGALAACDAVVQQSQADELTLNVTGGTKITALAAYQQFYFGGKRVIYMDTEHEQLLELGDQPTAMPVRQNLLDVKLCLACYGKRFNEAGTRSKIDTARRRKAATEKLCRLFLNNPDMLRACNRQLNEYDKKEPPFFLYVNNLPGPGTELFDLLVQEGIAVPSGADTLCLQSEAARIYLNGGWLEEYVFNLIKGLSINGLDCLLNVNFEWQIQRAASKKKKTENELDVVFSCNNRLHIISCKTSSLDILKNAGKDALHELDSMKANVGGLFARPLLVSVHPLKDADFRRAQNLKIPVVSGNNILHLQERLQQEWGIGR